LRLIRPTAIAGCSANGGSRRRAVRSRSGCHASLCRSMRSTSRSTSHELLGRPVSRQPAPAHPRRRFRCQPTDRCRSSPRLRMPRRGRRRRR
jgi:hypothetical protein